MGSYMCNGQQTPGELFIHKKCEHNSPISPIYYLFIITHSLHRHIIIISYYMPNNYMILSNWKLISPYKYFCVFVIHGNDFYFLHSTYATLTVHGTFLAIWFTVEAYIHTFGCMCSIACRYVRKGVTIPVQ